MKSKWPAMRMPFIKSAEKVQKSHYIYKYKYVQNSQFIKEGLNTSFWHLFLQNWNTFLWIFIYKSNWNTYRTIRAETEYYKCMGCTPNVSLCGMKKIWELEAKCYNNCVYSLLTDLGKENEKKANKTKQNKTEETRINQGEENTGCDSCHLPRVVWKCTKGEKQKKKEAKIRDSNIAINWHSYGKRMMQ